MGDPSKGPTPPKWKLVIVKWVGLYPPLLAIVYGIDWISKRFFPIDWPVMNDDGTLVIWFKLMCSTLLLTPGLAYVITPIVDSMFRRFLYTKAQRDKMDAA